MVVGLRSNMVGEVVSIFLLKKFSPKLGKIEVAERRSDRWLHHDNCGSFSAEFYGLCRLAISLPSGYVGLHTKPIFGAKGLDIFFGQIGEGVVFVEICDVDGTGIGIHSHAL